MKYLKLYKELYKEKGLSGAQSLEVEGCQATSGDGFLAGRVQTQHRTSHNKSQGTKL
jgi:hypothetical protein